MISSSNFLIVPLGLSIYSVKLFADSESFTYFPAWIHFISFSSLIVMARTSKTMLNNSHEIGHPCLIPEIRGNAFTFSPLRIMFAVENQSNEVLLADLPNICPRRRRYFYYLIRKKIYLPSQKETVFVSCNAFCYIDILEQRLQNKAWYNTCRNAMKNCFSTVTSFICYYLVSKFPNRDFSKFV